MALPVDYSPLPPVNPDAVLPSAPPFSPFEDKRNIQHIFLEIVPPPPTVFAERQPTTIQKVMKISALLLAGLGVAFLLAGAAYFGMSIFTGSSNLIFAESIFPFGLISLISSSHLFNMLERGDAPRAAASLKIGPLSVAY